MSLEHCTLSDGSVIHIGEIRDKCAQSIFQTSLFYDVCDFLARAHKLDGLEHKVLVNLYALKSSRVKDIAALAYYVNEHVDGVFEVCALDDSIAVLQELIGAESIVFRRLGGAPHAYIEKANRQAIAMKIILNRLFRLVPSRVSVSPSIVRGWVDVTEAMYAKEVFSSSLLLYPFPFGMARQFRFFRSVKKRGGKVRFSGLPYQLSGLLRLLFAKGRGDVDVVRIETSAYQRYARELIAEGVKVVYTSDEFEVASIALYERLIEAGVTIINTAHGVGLYSPYVAYSEFKGINASQSNFYQQRCSGLKPSIRKSRNTKLPLASVDASRALPPAVVLLDQNFLTFNCVAESNALVQTQRILEEFCSAKNVPFFIKVHPNSSPTEQLNGSVRVRDWAAISGFRPIFVTVNSTAFYDVQGYGPVLVCDEPSFLPEIYFGGELLVYRYVNLVEKLLNLIQEDAWWTAASKHMPNVGD
ncbi:hypothetical protein [Pseudomonas sp. PS01298]|uniref:hypothetical protein n=1 Tax=Pseudomonas sp. PS01298 TaxID=2991434 RepID=UPI000EA22316|nr:hypothetical protein [Pseudomonas sp. PS01298]AYF47617.1 hypothetical protein DXV65_08430 [Pseudomonas fluorescens]QTV18311.1 hypothetical protein J9321_05110 [Pseudomonas fluorescens]